MAAKVTWCPHCGTELPGGAIRCSNCGQWIRVESTAESQEEKTPASGLPPVEQTDRMDTAGLAERGRLIWQQRPWLVISGGILCVIVLALLVKSVTGATSSSGCDPQNCAMSAHGSGKLKGDPLSPNKFAFQAWDHSAVNYSYDCHGKDGQFYLTLWTDQYPVGDSVQYNSVVADSGTGKSGIERFDAPGPVHWTPDVDAPSFCDWSFTITKQ